MKNENDTQNESQNVDWEQARREREAAEEVKVNNPDAVLNEKSEADSQQTQNDPGDNLTEQHPTQDQTVGESGVSGRDDEEYNEEER